ncbi:MAG: hypothetical protein U0Z26_12050 [Anaerolineales bacterium]
MGLTLAKGQRFLFVVLFNLAVSSTMMPSDSDRDAWLPLSLWVISLLALALFAGFGSWDAGEHCTICQ